MEKGQQVYVSGRLVSDTVEGDDEKDRQVYYKVYFLSSLVFSSRFTHFLLLHG